MERRTQAERRAESRARIIDAAAELLAVNGYARTSLVEIGRVAGLSRGLVSHHFGSKEACMRAVLCHISQTVIDQMTGIGSVGLDGIDRAIDVYFELVTIGHLGSRALHVILTEGMTSTPGLQPAVADANARVRAALLGILLGFDPPASAAAQAAAQPVVVALEGILRGVSLQWMADPANIDLDAAVATIKQMVNHTITASGLVG